MYAQLVPSLSFNEQCSWQEYEQMNIAFLIVAKIHHKVLIRHQNLIISNFSPVPIITPRCVHITMLSDRIISQSMLIDQDNSQTVLFWDGLKEDPHDIEKKILIKKREKFFNFNLGKPIYEHFTEEWPGYLFEGGTYQYQRFLHCLSWGRVIRLSSN